MSLVSLISNLDQAQVERGVRALESIAASLDVLVQATLPKEPPKPPSPAGPDALHDVSDASLAETEAEIAAMRKRGMSETEILGTILSGDHETSYAEEDLEEETL